MATHKNHMVLGSVEDNGDVNEIYPIADAEDVNVKRNNGNIPSDVGNLQQLTDKMSAVAFNDSEDMVFAGNTMELLLQIVVLNGKNTGSHGE